MIPVTDLRNFSFYENTKFQMLKPWWDVFAEYTCLAMLMIGVFGCTLQLTSDKISCLPYHSTTSSLKEIDCSHIRGHSRNQSFKHDGSPQREMFGRKNNLDIHQYIFANNYCYERAVHWYGKYFPYLVVIHTLIFFVASNFWFRFPGTSSKMEIFVRILEKCFNSHWTTRAISEVSEENEERNMVIWKNASEKYVKEGPVANEETVTLLQSPSSKSNPEKKALELPTTVSLLDKKEGEQAKALFERVKKFRVHVEEADLLYTMYVLQTCLKVFKFLLIIIYSIALVPNIKIVVKCSIPKELTGYSSYCCNHIKGHLFSKLAYCYIVIVGVYGLMCIYTLYWLFHRSLKQYSFENVRLETGIDDIPDVKNDVAFLLYLCDLYDPLYSKRFAIFLSEVSESRLQQVSLNNEWPLEKLQLRLSRNSSERLELHLMMFSGLPETVFDLLQIEALKLEKLPNITVPAAITRLTLLQELALVNCLVKLQQTALTYLQEHLKVLRLTFDGLEQVPLWMYTLHCLEELHLTGPLTHELSRSSSLDTLRELRSLRVLALHSRLTKIPPSLVDIGGWLQRLAIHNEGVALRNFSGLKKLSRLGCLELVGCELTHIPRAIFSLTNLQELELKENKLTALEDIIHLQHCQKLATLKVSHNTITYIPKHICKLLSLETLNFSWNRIDSLPTKLFYCTKLHHLNLSHNFLSSLPPEISILQSLQYFNVASNSLDSLPEDLFSCKRLKTLILADNYLISLSPRVANLVHLERLEIKGNRFESLPSQIGDCPLLKLSGLVVEEFVIDLMPKYIRTKMSEVGPK